MKKFIFRLIVSFVLKTFKNSQRIFNFIQYGLFTSYIRTKDKDTIKAMLYLTMMRYYSDGIDKITINFVENELAKSNNMVTGGMASITKTGEVSITFDIDNIVYFLEKGSIDINDYSGFCIYQIALHEIWHVRQFTYLFNKGGSELINLVREREEKFEYPKGPIEQGAFRYSDSNTKDKQNLEELLV